VQDIGFMPVKPLQFPNRTMLPKNKSRTVGVARQQRHFLCGDKENEAKENLARRLAFPARYHGNINFESTVDSLSTDPP